MCDYSLELYATRPAQESEIYVTTRFPSGSIGFAAPGDCTTAVCVSYGTKLTLENLPAEVQQELDVGPMEGVVFARVDGLHHDGVRFANGRTVLLHRLGVGVLGSLVSDKLADSEKKTAEQKIAEAAQARQEPRIPVEPAE
jgi:hypothetical protein